MPSEKRARGPKRARRIRRSLAPAIAALVVGCAPVDEDASTSSTSRDDEPASEAAPLAEVRLPGRQIQWFSPEPGVLMEVEQGEIDATRAAEPELSMIERYESLTGAKAPRALREAQARVNALRDSSPALTEERTARSSLPDEVSAPSWGQKGRHGGYITQSSFDGAYCIPTDRFWGASDPDTWFRSPSMFEDRVEYFKAGVYTIDGVIKVRQTCHNDIGKWVFVSTGKYVGIRCDSVINQYATSEVQTGGDLGVARYRHCINYHF
jgi:hypothetical protein